MSRVVLTKYRYRDLKFLIKGFDYDITGYTFASQIRDADGALVAELDVDVNEAERIVTFTLDADATGLIEQGNYLIDISQTAPGPSGFVSVILEPSRLIMLDSTTYEEPEPAP